MSYREYERLTNQVCKRGARIKIRRTEFFALQQDGPFDVEEVQLCCPECERESLDA
ncbi:hypothetical protein [Mycolicibacterium farcinogenes]|uniref:Uncharacterized protein n=1 Tax=Mycolicibacterium farcinogenes TaxID=1802 RepID=A0ACD1FMW0_MYCFR|nr:hypothetical protein [Mycolicibacterium farcinogenes]QZH68325.1 hypothetical protein K6L26_12265 [Mycolicibacterium farcinogenes]